MATFDEEKFNMEVRKFLKKVGVTSQREIESAVRAGLQSGKLKGGEQLKTRMKLEIAELGALSFPFGPFDDARTLVSFYGLTESGTQALEIVRGATNSWTGYAATNLTITLDASGEATTTWTDSSLPANTLGWLVLGNHSSTQGMVRIKTSTP